MTSGRRSLLFVGVLIAALVIAVVVVWFAVLKPQNEQIKDTLDATGSQIDKTAAMRAENDRRQQQIAQLRRMAFELRNGGKDDRAFMDKITNDGKWKFREVVENDPIVAPIAKTHPGLIPAMRSGDYLAVWSFAKDLPISSEDKAYVETFSKTVGLWPE